MTARPRAILLLAALALLLTAGCAGGDDASSVSESGGAAQFDGDEAATDDGADVDMADDAEEEAVDADAPAALPGGGGSGLPSAVPAQSSARSGERLIKDGTMTVEVTDGGFLAAYRQVIAAATDLGGYVTSTTSRTGDDARTSGSVTVRVPVERYEDLLSAVADAGELRHQDVTTRDVTGEFVDLEARLRHLRAQEAFYLELLEEAEGVQDAISVKQQLDGIQSDIEQIRGRLAVLEDRTSYSTLTVEIVEPGSDPVVAAGGSPQLSQYLQAARDGFVTVIGWLLVGVVSLLPLLVPALAAFVIWRLRRGPVATATVKADAE